MIAKAVGLETFTILKINIFEFMYTVGTSTKSSKFFVLESKSLYGNFYTDKKFKGTNLIDIQHS